MADAMSPSIAPDTGGSKFDIKTWASKNWWLLLIAGAVVIFLLYSLRKTSSAPASVASDGSVASAQGNAVSATQPDQSNVIDMISTQFQTLMNQLQSQNVDRTPPGIPATQPFSRTPAAQSKPVPRPTTRTAVGGMGVASSGTTRSGFVGPPVSAPGSTYYRPGPIGPPDYLNPQPVPTPWNPGVPVQPWPNLKASRLTQQWPGLHGSVPPAGAAVPFGTFVHPHEPLNNSGKMYTTDRAV